MAIADAAMLDDKPQRGVANRDPATNDQDSNHGEEAPSIEQISIRFFLVLIASPLRHLVCGNRNTSR